MNSYTKKIYFKQEEVNDSGPSVNSDDIEQRILARRIRIQNRINMQKAELRPKESDEDKEKVSISENQIELSTQRISKLIRDGDSFISNIRVACDARENLRRAEEDEMNRIRIKNLEDDAKESQEKFDYITERWDVARASELPKETRDLLSEQKNLCTELVGEKNKLINELNLEIKAKDDHYVRELKKRTEDIDLLASRMESQLQAMKKVYREELNAIESAFLLQKDELESKQNNEWDLLMNEIKQKQINYITQHQIRNEEFEKELKELRIKHSEEYNCLKISLESEVEALENQLLKLKATYQLNLEKLEYNFQVLKRRDEENMITKSNQKRKITRLQDVLNNLHNKAAKQEKQYSIENEQLSEDYKKRMENFRDLQKKSKLLIEAEHRNFRDIWLMNEEALKKLANRLLDASRVINEQQLGLTWIKPDTSFMNNIGPLKGPQEQVLYKPPAVIAMQLAFNPESLLHGQSRIKTDPNTLPTSLKAVTPDVIKEFLQLLCYEPEFLIEEKLRRLFKPLAHDEEMLMRLDTILTALGVENEDDLDDLFTYFIHPTDATSSPEKIQALKIIKKSDDPINRRPTQSSETENQTTIVNEKSVSNKENNSQESESTTYSDKAVVIDEPVPLNNLDNLSELNEDGPRPSTARLTMDCIEDPFDTTKFNIPSMYTPASETPHDKEPKIITFSEVSEVVETGGKEGETDKHKHTEQKKWELISPVNVVNALHQFTIDMRRRELQGGARCTGSRIRPEEGETMRNKRLTSSHSIGESKPNLTSNIDGTNVTGAASTDVDANKRDDSHDEAYWNKYAYSLVSPENEKVWGNLYTALDGYFSILKHRSKLIQDTENLRRQNGELRHLLQQYLNAKVNYELQIPPAKTIQLT